jgi:outer membrane protein OmpA-like peptidoglycan-associated protein
MLAIFVLTFAPVLLFAGQQSVPNPTQNVGPNTQVVSLERTPIYRVTVVQRSTKAINYRHRSGATKVDFKGTALLPQARGQAKVESKKGYIEIEVEFDGLQPASAFGPEYLTYVLWAISPEGRATNLGEILLDDRGRGKLNVTTELQAFGMIVTAEPYFAVTQPSDVVVMENVIRSDTKGKVEEIDAKFELLQRGQYVFNVDQSAVRPMQLDRRTTPLELYEARNAVQIARWTNADRYAADTFQKAEKLLQQAEEYHRRKQTKPAIMTAREAVQTAEDARLIAIQRMEAERQENERRAAAEREAEAKRKAEEARLQAQQEARARELAEQKRREEELKRMEEERQRREAEARRAQAEQERLAAEKAKAEAERAKAEALAAAQEAERLKREAELAQQQLALEAEKAKLAAAEAERARQQAEADKENLRRRLLQQLNMILETRDTARGLIVNMSDVLFDSGKHTLRPGAREKLAKVAGILLAHPGLRLEVEGHTDSVGSEAYNQRLSELRAQAVRDYLISQGISPANITARGFGETMPIADNRTAAGRQMNRRVELIVSGEVIGAKLTDIRSTVANPPPQP